VKRHETDYFSLAAGLLFTALGIAFAVSAETGWQVDGRWLVPTMLIVLGAGGLAASVTASRRQRRDPQEASSGATGREPEAPTPRGDQGWTPTP